MNSYFLSAHFNKYHSFHIISEVFLRISKVILLLLKEISCDTPWKEWGRHGISHHISLKVPERRETHEKGMGKNGKEKGQELNGKKMELNGGKWERQWRICEFALFEKNEDIWVCPGTLRVTRQSPTSSPGQNHASTTPKRKPGKT